MVTSAPGRAWKKPTYYPCGVRCGWYDKAAVRQLRMTIQQQLGRAINLLFREEGLPALAQIKRGDDSA
jgi:hypothetical protein